MARPHTFDERLSSLLEALATIRGDSMPLPAIATIGSALDAARFHLNRRDDSPIILAVIGGTGTGKSTLFNRILGRELTASSFRRTFTAGPVAAAANAACLPPKWLGLPIVVVDPANLPVRGRPDQLMVVPIENELTRKLVLVDTPDLDGDEPLHHAQADRVFRWADALLFLVTPEKYQMTELLPYYRLARRYGTTALFAMNKVESAEVVGDYAQQLAARGDLPADRAAGRLFAIPRDDAGYEPGAEMTLASLRAQLGALTLPDAQSRRRGAALRVSDALGRLRDQVIAPLRSDQREGQRLIQIVHNMESPATSVDVNPLLASLQRRLQKQSVLYLMGPGRMLDRVRQVPGFIARLPRNTWDLFRGEQPVVKSDPVAPPPADAAENFRIVLADQLAIVQSRIDDIIRSSGRGTQWLDDPANAYAASKLPTEQAIAIADEEIAALKDWMNQRWNATPRDTAMIKKLIKHLPGGEKLTTIPEAAPWLLFLLNFEPHFHVLHALTFGGYSLVTWLTEKISNEVAAQAKKSNQRIADRFTALAHQQIEKSCAWLAGRVAPAALLDQLDRLADEITAQIEQETPSAAMK
jgi:hypothetical protein